MLGAAGSFAADRPQPGLAAQLLGSAGVTGGLIVHVNAGDGRLTAALRLSDAFVVHGIERDPAQVAAAREHIRAAGVYGPVSVEQWDGPSLPYAEDLVNAVIVSAGPGAVPDDELLRVLAPKGRALIEDRNAPAAGTPAGWRELRKPWPGDIDEWTHYLHGADGNAVARDRRVGPPDVLHWEAPREFSRSHEHDTSMPAMVTAAGRVFHIVDEGPPGVTDKRLTEKWFLVARDAFSGIQLWRRPIPEWGWQQWDPSRAQGDWAGMREFRVRLPVTVARRLVTDGQRVFVTLGYEAPVSILDAATGDTLQGRSGSGPGNWMVGCGVGPKRQRLAAVPGARRQRRSPEPDGQGSPHRMGHDQERGLAHRRAGPRVVQPDCLGEPRFPHHRGGCPGDGAAGGRFLPVDVRGCAGTGCSSSAKAGTPTSCRRDRPSGCWPRTHSKGCAWPPPRWRATVS